MNIFVCVKQVPDTETKVAPTSDGAYVETGSIKWIMNPYDEFAVEQALLVKAANAGSTVTVVRVGPVRDTECLRTAMAMGADEAILVESPDQLDSLSTAKALKGAIEKSGKSADLILTGRQAIDDDNLIVPQMLAELMGMPSVSIVNKFEQAGETLTLNRQVSGGAQEVYEVSAPCVVACTTGLNQPRYASLPGIMKAKRKPLAQHSLADVGVSDADQRVNYSNFRLPPEKPPGKKFEAMEDGSQSGVVTEVVKLLREEAKVL